MVVDGQETFPLVPVAVGLFSIFFNVFNVLILFPFVNLFERVLNRIGHSDLDIEDYSIPRYLDRKVIDDFSRAVPAMRQEVARTLQAEGVFLDIARGKERRTQEARRSTTRRSTRWLARSVSTRRSCSRRSCPASRWTWWPA